MNRKKRERNYIRACILTTSISGSEYYDESIYILAKYTFKINNVVIYFHIGSACDPAGTLTLVLLDPNTRSSYDK